MGPPAAGSVTWRASPACAPQDSPEAGTKQEVAALLLQLLRQKAAMLDEHWGLTINEGAPRFSP